MTITAAQILNRARDLHAALSEQNAPDVLMFRELSARQDTFFDKIFARVPAMLAKVLTVPLPLADFDAGVDLATEIPGGWKDLTPAAEFRLSGTPVPRAIVEAKFIPWEQRLMGPSLPAFTLRDNTLFFLGSDTNYARFTEFRLTYTPIPERIVDEDSVVALPDDALEPLAAGLASFGLRRLVGNPLYGVTMAMWRTYDEDAALQEAMFLRRIFMGIAQRQNYSVKVVS